MSAAFSLHDYGERLRCVQTPQSAVQTISMLTPKLTDQDTDQVSVLSSDVFRKHFRQAVSVISNGSNVDLRQTFGDIVGMYDVTAEANTSASGVCDAVAAASGDCVTVCLHLSQNSRQEGPPPPPPSPPASGTLYNATA